VVQFVEDRSSITQFELGEMFRQETKKAGDLQAAVKWYKKSAMQGYSRAQSRLAMMYVKGQGVSRNYIKAYAWCLVAAAQKSRKALRNLNKIRQYLNDRQIAVARKLARLYYDIYVAKNQNQAE
jgi:TPR repeat protein